MEIILETIEKPKNTLYKKNTIILSVFFVIVLIGTGFVYQFLFADKKIPEQKIVIVPSGYSIIQTGNLLEENNIIQSGFGFRVLAQYNDISVKSGPYLFDTGNISLQNVIDRVSTADYGQVYETITIPEGSTNNQIAEIIKNSSFDFDQDVFNELTVDKEGYLFPDTYSLLPSSGTADIIKTMITEFDRIVADLESDIESSERTLQEIIIMASIIEKEATGDLDEKKTVSGILWKRIDEGMLLQVDAPFQYINGQVRAADLRIDGLYNTYTRAGLTPTAIGNPGLDSIIAALNPISSSYYFYLHAPDGQIHYANTYNGHINNINRYLR